MTDELKQHIIDYELGKLTKEELFLQLPIETEAKSELVRNFMESILASKASEEVETGLTLIWELEENNEYIDFLHRLLLAPWHSRYEDIIHDLQRRKQNSSVPIIKEAIQKTYEYLESYGTGSGQFISQCGYALTSIGTADAVQVLTELSHSDNEILSREMKYQLKRRSNHPDTGDTAKTPRWWT